MAIVTREQIDKAPDIITEAHSVEEWVAGGEVLLKVMSGDERDEWENELYQINGKDVKINRKQARARLLARIIVDPSGKPLYGDKEISALGKKSSVVLDRLWTAARKLNRLDAKDIEELAKNSEAGPVEGSPSASPAT